MSERESKPRPRRRKRGLIIGLILLALGISTALYLRSDAFAERVRRRVVSEIEADTGARVEVKSFTWSLSRLEFVINDVTLHGREAPGEVPYAHADRIVARLKILSFMSRTVALRYLAVEHPVIHLIVYPDGSTNQPAPQARSQVISASVQAIFALSVGHVEIHNGEVFWNDHPVPFELRGENGEGTLDFLPAERRYGAKLSFGTLDATIAQYRPLHGRMELDLVVGRDVADIKALHLETAGSRVDANGRVTDFNDPQVELNYRLQVSAAELGGFARVREMRGGEILTTGHGHYDFRKFSGAGRIFLRRFEWNGAGVRVPSVDGAADYTFDQHQIRVTHLAGDAFGGTVTGEGTLTDWLQSLPGTPARGPVPHGVFHFTVHGAQLANLATAVATKQFPLDRMHLAGTASGTADVEWQDSPEYATTQVVLDIDPPANPAPDQVPITAHLATSFSARAGQLTVTQLSAATRGTTLNAAGVLGSKTGRVTVAVNTTDLAAISPVLAAFRPLGQMPLEVQGRASFTGSVTGRLQAPTVAGHLEINDFDTVFQTSPALLNATAPPPAPVAHKSHWDVFRGDIVYTPDRVTVRNGFLQQGSATANFDASAALTGEPFGENTPFELHARIEGAEFRDLQSLVGRDYPLTGKLRLTLDVSGTEANLTGTGDATLTGGTLFGEPFQSLHTALRFIGGEVQAHDLLIRHNGAQVTGELAYAPARREFRLDLTGNGFDLAHVQRLQAARVTMQGTGAFKLSGSGTLDQPSLNGHLSLRDLIINGEAVGDVEADAVTHGADMDLKASSRLQQAEMTAEGRIHLRDDFPATLHLSFSHFDVDPVLRAYLGKHLTGHSSLGGRVDLQGPLTQPELLTVNGDFDQFSAEVENVHVASQGPIHFSLSDQVVHLDRLQLIGEGTDVSGHGTMRLNGARDLDFTLNGHLNLKLFETLNPDLTSSGDTYVDVHIGGTVARPDMSGKMQISNAAVSFVDLPNGLSDVNGTLTFDQNRLRVQTLTARSGGGTLSLGGFISYAHGLYFNLTATSTDVRLRYPPGVSAVGNANLHLEGTTASSLLSGDITITKFGVNPRFDFAQYIARAQQPSSAPQPDSPLNNMRLDLHIVSTPELQVETSLAKVTGNADLHLRGTPIHPSVLGRVTIVQGDVAFAGTQYHIERGEVTFTNPVRIEPILNIDATARVRDYDVTLGFHGSVDHLLTTYRSDPPLPTADIIALLAMGRTSEEVILSQQQATPNVTETASSAILGEALNATVSSRVQRLFGISRVKIDPQVGGAEGNPNARLTIEQQVSDKVTLTYITNLSQSAQQVVQVEYNVNRNVSIVAVRDEFGVVAFSLVYRQRKR